MELSARTALLLTLVAGPGFGLDLIQRARERTGGTLRLNRGGVYVALRTLEREGLVQGWMRRLPGVGRPRRYYELTSAGISEAEKARAALAGLLETGGRVASGEDARRMADRVREATDLSAFAMRLRDAGRRAGLG